MLSLEGIDKRWKSGEGEVRGLAGVDLEIRRGEFVTVMGASGSGKSTLLQILGLLDQPTEGRYAIEGRDVTSLPDRELARIRSRHFGFVFQRFHLLPELSALENVALPMAYAGAPKARRRERAEELLAKLGLGHRLGHRPGAMSGGEQQRVAIARALANDPGFLLADEPTGNLPSETGREIMGIIEGLHREGMTVVLVTHDKAIGAMGTRRVSIADGVMVSDSLGETLGRETTPDLGEAGRG